MAPAVNLAVFFFCSFFLCCCYTGEAVVVPAMYVFGDSLADVGNNNHLRLSLLKANFPHNGVDFPGGRATGRFSNGKNTADFLAEKIGVPSPPPYLSLALTQNKSDAYLRGVNFASGGAGILDGSARNPEQCLPLNKQIEYFSAATGVLVQQMGQQGAQTHLSESLVLVVVGSNDMFGYLRADARSPTRLNPQQFVDSLIQTLGGQLKRMYNLGARKLALVGTGAIGCCPSQRSQNRSGECSAEANYLSQKYNEGAGSFLEQLRSELPGLTYSFFDTYTALLEVIQRPEAYGFVEVRSACCGLGNLKAKVACLPIASYCSDRRGHLFWDFYHPTEALYALLVDGVFDGPAPVAYPFNVKQLIAT